MKKIKTLSFIILLSLLSACASIPPESVDLSGEIGVGLRKQHQSQVDLVNFHFAIQRKNLDDAFSRALATYFEQLTPSDTITLNRNQLNDVATDVLLFSEKNNEAKEELEKARIFLIRHLNENFLILNQANSSVTGLLQSAVTVKDVRSQAYKKLAEASDGKIDLNKVFSELDNFISKGGEEAGQAIKLVEKFESILNKEHRE